MTALAMQSLSFSTKVLEKFWKGLVTFLAKTMIGWQMARQMQANWQIAHMLQHEYPGKSVQEIAVELNSSTLEEVKLAYEKYDA